MTERADRPARDGEIADQLADMDRGRDVSDLERAREGRRREPAERPEPREPVLIPRDIAADFARKWESVQADFIDEPRGAVADADRLVGEVMSRLTEVFEDQRRSLEAEWAEGEPSTEDLRLALQRYRSFFRSLVAT